MRWGQWVALAANFLGEILLSALGPVGGLGSEFFGGNFAKYLRASGRAFDSKLFGGNFAKYHGATGGAVGGLLTANFSGEILLSTLGPVGGLGSELFRGNFALCSVRGFAGFQHKR